MARLHTGGDDRSPVSAVLSGYAGGFRLVEGRHSDAVERFVLLGKKDSPRLLLPLTQPLLKKSLKGFLGGRSFAAILSSFIRLSLLVGGPFAKVCGEYSLLPCEQSGKHDLSPIRKLLADILERDDFQIALRFSFGRPNGKTVAMALSDDAEVLCFAKIGSETTTSELVSHESKILQRYENTDIPIVMPERLYSGNWCEGHTVLITKPLQVEPLSSDPLSAHRTAVALAGFDSTEKAELSKSTYWADLVERVNATRSELNKNTDLLHSALSEIERIWGSCTYSFGISHGDWTRANVGTVGGNVAGWDWERCLQLAPTGIDLAHFAIGEKPTRAFSKQLDVENTLTKLRHYMRSAELPMENEESLVLLALVEMIIRFKSAQKAGVKSTDSKFESALRSALRSWAV